MKPVSTLEACNFGNFQFWQLAILTTFNPNNFQFWQFQFHFIKIYQINLKIENVQHHTTSKTSTTNTSCMDLAIKNGALSHPHWNIHCSLCSVCLEIICYTSLPCISLIFFLSFAEMVHYQSIQADDIFLCRRYYVWQIWKS